VQVKQEERKMADDVNKLYRSRDERMIAGICGGLGRYFDLDPTLVRALFILFALVVGGGLLLYLILWLLIPEEPGHETAAGEGPGD
jgi:phage shock protein C